MKTYVYICDGGQSEYEAESDESEHEERSLGCDRFGKGVTHASDHSLQATKLSKKQANKKSISKKADTSLLQ